MNIHTSPSKHKTTQAAEGLPRWHWTVQDLDRMVEAGLMRADDRVELIKGEIVPMAAAKGPTHENLKGQLTYALSRAASQDQRIINELGWRPTEDIYLEPDIIVIQNSEDLAGTPASNVVLVVEVADTSLAYDLRTKAQLYAELGIGEYWVINAKTLETRVHLGPKPEGYSEVKDIPAGTALTPQRLTGLSLDLSTLA